MSTTQQIEKIKGYKVTDGNMRCRGFQYVLDAEYKHNSGIELCGSGFHFCLLTNNCFNYYDFTPNNRVFEIEAWGEVINGDDKSVASNIKFIKELTWNDVLILVNTGTGNTGRGNAGNRNAGNRNAGYANAGNDNAGYANAGNRNAGYANAGNDNAGNYNAGNRNAGYANAGNDNAGNFNTDAAPYSMFNKKSKWTFEDFKNSDAFRLLNSVDTTLWVPSSRMTDEEKAVFPYHVTTQGYVKHIPFKEAFQNSWHNWSENNRNAFISLPNFNKEIFFEVTGVKVK